MTKNAFTLAEVLITLGIIGVVAAMTIPTLMNATNSKEIVTALKKAYSTYLNAYTLAQQENGTPDSWGITNDGAGAGVMLSMLKPYLNVTKDCGVGGSCFSGDSYKALHSPTDWGVGNGDMGYASVQLADGSIIASRAVDGTCSTNWGATQGLQSVCGFYYVDINGFKKPNQCGKDFFLFYLTKSGIIPAGTTDDTRFSFASDCLSATAGGWGCTAWTIYNENQDYTKGCASSLAWDGATKCN